MRGSRAFSIFSGQTPVTPQRPRTVRPAPRPQAKPLHPTAAALASKTRPSARPSDLATHSQVWGPQEGFKKVSWEVLGLPVFTPERQELPGRKGPCGSFRRSRWSLSRPQGSRGDALTQASSGQPVVFVRSNAFSYSTFLPPGGVQGITDNAKPLKPSPVSAQLPSAIGHMHFFLLSHTRTRVFTSETTSLFLNRFSSPKEIWKVKAVRERVSQ